MRDRRPLECPACGHDGIVRRPQELTSETEKLRVRVLQWTCRLCAYTWSQPAMPMPRPW